MKQAYASLCVLALLAACAGDPPPDARPVSDAGSRTTPDPLAGGRGAGSLGGVIGGPLSEAQKRQLQDQLHASVGDRVFFLTDRSDLTAEAQGILAAQAAFMRQYANLTFTIEGHADERGTREYNLALGDRRAAAVRKFLVSSGIADSRIHTVSYGKERPAIALSNEQGWAKNRRGVTLIE